MKPTKTKQKRYKRIMLWKPWRDPEEANRQTGKG